MRLLAHVGVGYLVLLLAGPIWPVLPFEVVAPNVTVVFAAYLGITARHRVADATGAAVLLGYLSDLLSGSPRGLMALVAGIVCVLAKLTTARLLVRGYGFVGGFCAASALLATLLTLGLRAAFSPAGGLARTFGSFGDEAVVALGSAFLTGLVAPALFRLCRQVDSRFARTEREREAVREGYLN